MESTAYDFMKKTLLLFVAFCGFVMSLCAQETKIDVVYLKNGSVIKGEIVEQIPNKQLTVETNDGSVFVCDFGNIEKIKKESFKSNTRNPLKKVLSSEKSYNVLGSRWIVDLGYTAGGYKGPELYASYGMQINPYLFIGGGSGIQYLTDYTTVSIPVFADIRGYAFKGAISPFIALRIGYKFNIEESPVGSGLGGFYCNPFIGCRFIVSSTCAVNLGVGMSIQKYTSKSYSFYSGKYYSFSGNMTGFTFKVGYEF